MMDQIGVLSDPTAPTDQRPEAQLTPNRIEMLPKLVAAKQLSSEVVEKSAANLLYTTINRL